MTERMDVLRSNLESSLRELLGSIPSGKIDELRKVHVEAARTGDVWAEHMVVAELLSAWDRADVLMREKPKLITATINNIFGEMRAEVKRKK